MIKKHKKFKVKTMRRTARIYLNDLNHDKSALIYEFLYKCHDLTQYFIDVLWCRQDFTSSLSNKKTTDLGRYKFNTTARLAQAMCKQAKETVRSSIRIKSENSDIKPLLRNHTVTLYSLFCKVEVFNNTDTDNKIFDYAVKLIGSGTPVVILPIKSNTYLNTMLSKDWKLGKSIRLGIGNNNKLFVDLFLEKPTPKLKTDGRVVGMDSNYKAGLVFSDDQIVGSCNYNKINQFNKRQKHTYTEVKNLVGNAVNNIDFSNIKILVLEDLKNVKSNTSGKFPRTLNRRLSHWTYSYIMDLLNRKCEEHGIRIEKKDPWKTSQFCRICNKWDRRNRRQDKFKCINCDYSDNSDHNAAMNLEVLGLAGSYSIRLLTKLWDHKKKSYIFHDSK